MSYARSLFDDLGQFGRNVSLTLHTLQLVVAQSEVRIATHPWPTIWAIRQLVEHARLGTLGRLGVKQGMNRPIKAIGFAVPTPSLMQVFFQIPR